MFELVNVLTVMNHLNTDQKTTHDQNFTVYDQETLDFITYM